MQPKSAGKGRRHEDAAHDLQNGEAEVIKLIAVGDTGEDEEEKASRRKQEAKMRKEKQVEREQTQATALL